MVNMFLVWREDTKTFDRNLSDVK